MEPILQELAKVQEEELLFLNRKTRHFFHVIIKIEKGIPSIGVAESLDGFHTTTPELNIPVIANLPVLTENRIINTLAFHKHFKRFGYRPPTTFTQTKNGVRIS